MLCMLCYFCWICTCNFCYLDSKRWLVVEDLRNAVIKSLFLRSFCQKESSGQTKSFEKTNILITVCTLIQKIATGTIEFYQ